MRNFLLFLALLPLILPAQSTREDSIRLVQVIEDYGRFPGGERPAWATVRETEIAAALDTLREFRARLPDTAGLSTDQRIERGLLDFALENDIFQLEFGSHRFPLDAEGGFLTTVVYRLLNQRVRTKEEYAGYRDRLAALPTFLAEQRAAMARGLAEGKTNPALVVRSATAMIERTLATPAGESLFLTPVGDAAEWKEELAALVENAIYPAYAELLRFLQTDYLPGLRPGIGISEITDGREYYRQRVRYFTSDDVTPEEVFATGEREVARIRAEMEAVIVRTGFEGSFADFLHFLRTDERFYAKTPEALLERAAWITKRMEGKLPRYFNRLPRLPLTVAPVPAALAPNYTGGRYSPGSYRDRRAGAFWVNTYDLPSRPYYTLPALALHEGVPGHHTQMMLAAEAEGRSDFRRNFYLSAFGEGWALYCEFLGKEAGIYENDYEEFGRLTYEMWRACRLVVDPGMHYFGWTRERAVDFMASNTALSLHEVNTEIDRYIGWPGQAVSYKMGELKIRKLRTLAEGEMGKHFDLAAFHDLILANGAITMATMEALVREWIRAGTPVRKK